MSETTFAIITLLGSALLTAGLRRVYRFNQRLVLSTHNARQWGWSSHFNQAGRRIVILANLLIVTGFAGSTLHLLPVSISGDSVLIGLVGFALAIVLISGVLLWRLYALFGINPLINAVKQRLPEPPTRQTLVSVIQFTGQLCVAMIAVGWGFLRVIAASGVLDGGEPEQDTGWFLNYSTMKFDDGLDPTGMYLHDDD